MWPAAYRAVREALEAAPPRTFVARTRAFTLLKLHGQTICRRSTPRCAACPVAACCPFFARGASRARGRRGWRSSPSAARKALK